VGVSLICPGFIRTPLTAENRFEMPLLMEPEEAARRIVDGIVANRAVIAFPRRMRLLMLFLCALPRCVADAILAKAPQK
jgi:short-subunit dehydrogenase